MADQETQTTQKPKKKQQYNYIKKTGRPTDYKPEYCEEIIRYFNSEIKASKLPFLSKFAREIAQVCEDTAIEWTKKHPEFSESYKKAKDMQKEFLISQALAGEINPTAFIFTAKNMTNMRDKQEIETTNKNQSVGFDFTKMTMDDLAQLRNLLERIPKKELTETSK